MWKLIFLLVFNARADINFSLSEAPHLLSGTSRFNQTSGNLVSLISPKIDLKADALLDKTWLLDFGYSIHKLDFTAPENITLLSSKQYLQSYYLGFSHQKKNQNYWRFKVGFENVLFYIANSGTVTSISRSTVLFSALEYEFGINKLRDWIASIQLKVLSPTDQPTDNGKFGYGINIFVNYKPVIEDRFSYFTGLDYSLKPTREVRFNNYTVLMGFKYQLPMRQKTIY